MERITRFLTYTIMIVLFSSLVYGIDKITFSDKFSLEMISNTPQCFSCETIYEVCNLDSVGLSFDDFVVKFYGDDDKLMTFNYEVQTQGTRGYYEPVYESEYCKRVVNTFDTKTSSFLSEVIDYECNVEVGQEYKEVPIWNDLTPKQLVPLSSTECITFRVTGKLNQGERVDNRVNLKGYEFKEFAWWDSDWEGCRQINITNPVGALADFPVYINLNKSDDMKVDFSDIRFTNGTDCNNSDVELDYEISNYTTTQAHVWVRIPEFKVGVNTILVYYNNDAATDGQNLDGTWDSNFLLVAHLDGDALDSSGGGVNGSLDTPLSTDVNCSVSSCYKFDGTDDSISFPTNALFDFGTGDFTVEAYFKCQRWESAQAIFSNCYESGGWKGISIAQISPASSYDMLWETSALGFETEMNINTPYHFALSRQDSDDAVKWYLNATNLDTDSFAGSVDTTGNFYLSRNADVGNPRYSKCWIDEVRVSDNIRTADYFNASYFNIVDYSNFVLVGEEQIGVAGSPAEEPIEFNLIEPDINTTSGMLMYMFAFGIWIVLFIFGRENFVFRLIAHLYGFLLAVMLMPISYWLTFLFMIFNGFGIYLVFIDS